jgi:hypothetical protein
LTPGVASVVTAAVALVFRVSTAVVGVACDCALVTGVLILVGLITTGGWTASAGGMLVRFHSADALVTALVLIGCLRYQLIATVPLFGVSRWQLGAPPTGSRLRSEGRRTPWNDSNTAAPPGSVWPLLPCPC